MSIITSLAPTEPSAAAVPPAAYEGRAYVNIPGVLNIIFGIYEYVIASRVLRTADWEAARERLIDASIRILQSPLLILEAGTTISLNILKLVNSFKTPATAAAAAIKPLAAVAAGLGGAICALETIFELIDVSRTVQFASRTKALKMHKISTNPGNLRELIHSNRKEFETKAKERLEKVLARKEYFNKYSCPLSEDFEALEDYKKINFFIFNAKEIHKLIDHMENRLYDQVLIHRLQNVSEDYLTIPADQAPIFLEEKHNNLAGRVQPWLACKIIDKLPLHLSKLQSATATKIERASSRKKADRLITNMNIQTDKKRWAHGISFTAIGLTVIGIILSFIIPPLGLAFILAGMATAIFKFLFITGVSDTKGWRIEWENFRQKYQEIQKAVNEAYFAMIRYASERRGYCTAS